MTSVTSSTLLSFKGLRPTDLYFVRPTSLKSFVCISSSRSVFRVFYSLVVPFCDRVVSSVVFSVISQYTVVIRSQSMSETISFFPNHARLLETGAVRDGSSFRP